jgi:hypothetical protein
MFVVVIVMVDRCKLRVQVGRRTDTITTDDRETIHHIDRLTLFFATRTTDEETETTLSFPMT